MPAKECLVLVESGHTIDELRGIWLEIQKQSSLMSANDQSGHN
jgi:hypothetical protein